jgi:hypothetical protein
VFLKIFLEFLVGGSEVARKRALSSFQVEHPSEFLKTQVGSILIGNVFLGKRLIGDRKREFAVFRFGSDNPVKVFAAARL